jgi:Family of unknown function (DUF6308)
VARTIRIQLRAGLEVDEPLKVVLDFVQRGYAYDVSTVADLSRFGEADLRLANRGGARISAGEITTILERRRSIERALRAIAQDASLAGPASTIPWLSMRQLFDAFADIRGVGFAKMTKALHKKRPALIPMLDSVVQTYLVEDDLGIDAPFGERAIGLVRGYKRDLNRNRAELRTLRRELAKRDCVVTEVRILDVLIWSATSTFAKRSGG